MSEDFYSKNLANQIEQIKENLYTRLKEVENNIKEYQELEDDPDFEDTYGEGYRDCLISELFFLSTILDKFERS